jgi:hypothetical protein
MKTNTFRGAAAAVLSIGLVPLALTQAQAAPAPTPGQSTRAPITGLANLRAKLPALKNLSPAARADALRSLAQSPGSSSLAAVATGLTPLASTCPTGQTLGTVYSTESFEAGLPYPDINLMLGFTATTGVGAPAGSSWASSSLLAADPLGVNLLNSNFVPVPQTGKVYLSFTYRGAFVQGSTAALVNNDYWEPAPTASWTTVNLDITSEATTNLGDVEVYFGHLADLATAGSFDVDNVSVYGCNAPAVPPPAPNSGLRGDWSGQGTVDLMATRADGSLWMYEGRGTGAVGSGIKVGSGWSGFTWQGSPGDINADRRTDLLARRSDGTLWFYPGKGNGLLRSGTQVGTGWNSMTAIATPGDFDRDGRPDLLARRSDGTLHQYRILATGALKYVRQIGAGWNSTSSIIGMGDLNGDKRGDIIAVRANGTMFSYLSSGTGLTSAKQVGSGWNGMTALTSPGDMNKDTRGDLIARRADGTLWFYAGRTGGGVAGGKQVGSGWNGMLRIL